ncbi:MAG: hypothetical protein K8T25_09750 [Planctomycetia bacterium]|nr:hypothetical protein [Planctomycetia bacterium]
MTKENAFSSVEIQGASMAIRLIRHLDIAVNSPIFTRHAGFAQREIAPPMEQFATELQYPISAKNFSRNKSLDKAATLPTMWRQWLLSFTQRLRNIDFSWGRVGF